MWRSPRGGWKSRQSTARQGWRTGKGDLHYWRAVRSTAVVGCSLGVQHHVKVQSDTICATVIARGAHKCQRLRAYRNRRSRRLHSKTKSGDGPTNSTSGEAGNRAWNSTTGSKPKRKTFALTRTPSSTKRLKSPSRRAILLRTRPSLRRAVMTWYRYVVFEPRRRTRPGRRARRPASLPGCCQTPTPHSPFGAGLVATRGPHSKHPRAINRSVAASFGFLIPIVHDLAFTRALVQVAEFFSPG
jgi:hypothetical protein